MRPTSRRRQATAIIAASVFHVLVVLAIGLSSPTLRLPERSDAPPLDVIEVQLAPRLVPPRQTPAEHEPAPRPVVTAVAAPRPNASPPRPTPAPEAKPEPPRAAPTPEQARQPEPVKAPEKAKEKDKDKDKEKIRQAEAPRPAAPAPAPLPAAAPARAAATAASDIPRPDFRLPPGYGRVTEEAGGGLRGVLRATVGCEHQDYARLTAAEREHCLTALAREAGRGPQVDVIPASKREAYDREAAANERRRMQREGAGASPVIACDGPGSNLGGGCLPPEARSSVRPQ